MITLQRLCSALLLPLFLVFISHFPYASAQAPGTVTGVGAASGACAATALSDPASPQYLRAPLASLTAAQLQDGALSTNATSFWDFGGDPRLRPVLEALSGNTTC